MRHFRLLGALCAVGGFSFSLLASHASAQDAVINRAFNAVRGFRVETRVGTIMPGASVGRVHLGQTRAQARATWGRRPDKTFVLPGGLSSDSWHWRSSDAPEAHHIEVIYRSGRVTQIEVAASGFQTAQGVNADGTLQEWLGTYGKASRVARYRYNAAKKGVSEQKYYDWVGRGLAAETRHIEGRDYVNTAIVHPKGARVIPDFDGTLVDAS